MSLRILILSDEMTETIEMESLQQQNSEGRKKK